MDLLTPTLPFMRAVHVAALQPLAGFFSLLGTEGCYLLLLPLVYWLWNRRIGAQLGILLLLSVLLNDLVKLAFHLPRPFWIDPSLTPILAAQEWSFGFPSGHSQGAFLVWPYLALRATRKNLFLALAIALATCIAVSRLVLGVHWPLDVVGGALISIAILTFHERFGVTLEREFRGRPIVLQMALVVGFVLVCGGIGAFLIGRDASQLGQMDILRERLQPHITVDAVSPAVASSHRVATTALVEVSASMVSRCAALLGLVIGLMFAPPKVAAGGSAGQMALRLVIGLFGVAFFYLVLKTVLPDYQVFRFIRYFLTTFWVAGGFAVGVFAPWDSHLAETPFLSFSDKGAWPYNPRSGRTCEIKKGRATGSPI